MRCEGKEEVFFLKYHRIEFFFLEFSQNHSCFLLFFLQICAVLFQMSAPKHVWE